MPGPPTIMFLSSPKVESESCPHLDHIQRMLLFDIRRQLEFFLEVGELSKELIIWFRNNVLPKNRSRSKSDRIVDFLTQNRIVVTNGGYILTLQFKTVLPLLSIVLLHVVCCQFRVIQACTPRVLERGFINTLINRRIQRPNFLIVLGTDASYQLVFVLRDVLEAE